jgi:hypothetical protein
MKRLGPVAHGKDAVALVVEAKRALGLERS